MSEKCLICYGKSGQIWKCGCAYCVSCIEEWLLSQVKLNIDHEFILCPLISPGHIMKDKEIRQKINHDVYINFLEIKLKKDLAKREDYLLCPNLKCDFFGWTTSSCADYQCLKCQFIWKKTPILKRIFEEFDLSIVRLLSKICPSCGMAIIKNGGCNRMTCINCNYMFCWLCMEKVEKSHICNKVYSLFSIIMIMCGLVFCMKFFFSFEIIRVVIYWILWRFFYLVIMIIVCALNFLPQVVLILCVPQNSPFIRVFFYFLTLIISILLIISHIPSSIEIIQLLQTIFITFIICILSCILLFIKA